MTSQHQHSPDAFHRARSRCIDAFALAELNAIALLHAQSIKASSEPFKQKLTKLSKLEPTQRYTEAKKARVDQAIAELDHVLSIRADMVHSQLAVVELDGVRKACFRNPVQPGVPGEVARLFTLEEMNSLCRLVDELARTITQDS